MIDPTALRRIALPNDPISPTEADYREAGSNSVFRGRRVGDMSRDELLVVIGVLGAKLVAISPDAPVVARFI